MRNLEDLMRDAGGVGLAQVIIVSFATLTKLSVGWSMLEMSFANFVPKWCCLPDNLTATSDLSYCHQEDRFHNSSFDKKCNVNASSCSSRVFASGVDTIVNEWNLVCDRKWMVPLTTSIQMAGVLVGAMLTGQMSDLIGRKKTVFLNVGCCAIFSVVAGFSVSWEMFVAFRFLIGMTSGGLLAGVTPFATEFVLPHRRAVVSIMPTYQIGTCLMALVAWRFQDWRMVHWLCSAVTAPFLLGYFIIPDSPRWLAVQGRTEDAEKVIEWIAHWNKKEVPKDSREIIERIAAEVAGNGKQTKYTYIHIYKGWHLFKSSIILQFLWFVMSLCGYGLAFGASSLGNNMYLNIFLLAAVTIPAYLALTFIIERIGRIKTVIIALVLASACSFASLAVRLTVSDGSKKDLAITILSLFNRAFQGSGWSAIGVITNEIYPTVIRGLGYGAANVIARIGGIIAPFALNFEDSPNAAFSLLGAALLAAAFAVFFLEETAGKAMQDVTHAPPTENIKQTDSKQARVASEAASVDGTSSDGASHHRHAIKSDDAKVEEAEVVPDKVWHVTFSVEDGQKINGHVTKNGTSLRHLTSVDNPAFVDNTRL